MDRFVNMLFGFLTKSPLFPPDGEKKIMKKKIKIFFRKIKMKLILQIFTSFFFSESNSILENKA